MRNAFANLAVSIQKGGGQGKELEFQPSKEEAGWYNAEIVPTQTGAYSLVFSGQVAGQEIEANIPIEEVEDTTLLEFPQTGGGGGSDRQQQQITEQLSTILSDFSSQIEETRLGIENIENNTQKSLQAAEDAKASADTAYMMGMIGVGFGAAGIIVAVIMSCRNIS